MQLKGLVRFFAVALILISLYQLSFTFVVRNYEKKIKQQAEKDVAKKYPAATGDTLKDLLSARKQEIIDSTSGEEIAGFPWFVTYTKAKERELNLGLDLQGGMNVVLDVSVEDVIRSLSGYSKDPAFNAALVKAREMKKSSQSDFVTLFGEAYAQQAPQGKLASIFANASQKDLNFNSSNEQVLSVIRKRSSEAIKNTYLVLQKRIDKFGVAQPNISLDENKGIISVELAGVDDADRVRKYLQASANLEFREVHKNTPEFANQTLGAVNEAVRNYLGYSTAKTTTDTAATAAAATPAQDTAAAATAAATKDTSAIGSLDVALAADSGKGSKLDSVAKMQADFAKQAPLFAVMVPNMDQQGNTDFGPSIGNVHIKDTATLRRYFNLPAVKAVLPRDFVLAWGAASKNPEAKNYLPVYGLKVNPVNPKAKVTGEMVTDAKQSFDQNSNAEVSMTMDETGTREWRRMTGALKPGNIEDRRTFNYVAVVLDGIVYSAPSINGEIPNGQSSISGNFTVDEANDLANILKSGKMPAPAKIVQEQIVGPTLGAESIAAGAKSFAISFAVIFVLMLVYYNTGGWVANIALILNLLFTVGILASLGATLTMPGIAGLVLTIGMAVDTNVIIFERIKDELSRGRTYQEAVEHGYKRSLAPVLDGHITSLLTALILFYFGLGPVLGFATTQIIGLLLSLFCGILVSRMITDFWTNKKRHFEYFTPISRKIFKHANFDFVGKRKIAYAISAVVMVLGIASFFNGFDHGIDFAGGRSYTVRFDKEVNREEVRENLAKVFEAEPFVKTVGQTSEQLSITTSYKIEEQSQTIDQEVSSKLFDGLKPYYPAGTTYETFMSKYVVGSQTVSPTISDDLRTGAIKATVFSIIVIFLYILMRFSKWQYSIGTIFALLHDVLVTLAVFSFLRNVVPFPLEIDQHFIAAILTVIGFSMNDTVIVFDRIREYFRNGKGLDRNTTVNKAINDTLSRTIMTSFTVFLTILILFIFGGEATRGFAFAMLIGVITGTYSSIFVAAPVIVDFDRKNELANESEVVVVKEKAPKL
ncbi:protein translocase subunit SecDF [Chitinophaga horti]|uniref:Multifunctional fusion protein n=1 Tax=Chitinophaga horti TaxID=2920382 RepID=A0ABY6J7H8_9BACT|nr:protein translocase subunit SecDF [Chitinophaga horti]UYQ94241.1 protein translocase subunit SecDF [Chitinophaga horti]